MLSFIDDVADSSATIICCFAAQSYYKKVKCGKI